MPVITPELVTTLRNHFKLDWTGDHGAPHWARVKHNGLALARTTGAQIRIVEAFAFLHDSYREDEYTDPEHGLRAAEFAKHLVRRNKLLLEVDELELLVRACEGHSNGGMIEDINVCTCWDADRLDLGRVGIKPDARYLCTETAKNPLFIELAYQRSIGKLV